MNQPPELLRALVEAIPRASEQARISARADAQARPIHYPFGSGETDEIALLAGLRPLIRQLLSDAEIALTTRFAQRGFFVEVAPLPYVCTCHGWEPGEQATGATRRPVFISRDRRRIQDAIRCELEPSTDADRELGRLLGYPRCCVEAYVREAKALQNQDTIRLALSRTRGSCSLRLNVLDLAVFHWISWYPCTFDCALSQRYAAALESLVASREPVFVREIAGALGRHRLMLADSVQVSMKGTWDGRAIAIESAWPTARDRSPRASLSADELAAVTAVTAWLRGARTLSVDGDAIVVDGKAIALPCRPLIAPFGTAG